MKKLAIKYISSEQRYPQTNEVFEEELFKTLSNLWDNRHNLNFFHLEPLNKLADKPYYVKTGGYNKQTSGIFLGKVID